MRCFFIYATALSIILSSCVKHLELSIANDSFSFVHTKGLFLENESDDYHVSKADAELFIAKHFPSRTIQHIEPYVIDSDTLLFICSFDKGSIVLAGDKRVPPIVAQDDDSQMNDDKGHNGPLLWCYSYAEDIRAMKESGNVGYNDNVELWTSILYSKDRVCDNTGIHTKSGDQKWCVWYDGALVSSVNTSTLVPHLIATKWGQDYPWNTKTPIGLDANGSVVHSPTGCSAVAMAQVVYYMNRYVGEPQFLYHYIQVFGNCLDPDNPTYELARGDFVTSSNRWYQMATCQADTLSKSAEYVCDLMLDIGDRIGMEYTGTGSGAWPSSYGFSFFDLGCSSQTSYSSSLVKSNLNNSLPVIVVAWGLDSGVLSGHTWLIDGLVKKTTIYRHLFHIEYSDQWMHSFEYFESEAQMLQRYPNGYDGYSWEELLPSEVEYFLMNWGYDGDYDNGYYSTASSSVWSSNLDYQYDKVIYYNIYVI